jgi:hypothetical protein
MSLTLFERNIKEWAYRLDVYNLLGRSAFMYYLKMSNGEQNNAHPRFERYAILKITQ